MVKRSRRKRSVKHYMKEYEYSQEVNSAVDHGFESPIRVQIEQPEHSEIVQQQENVEIVAGYESRFEKEPRDSPTKSSVKSPLPHEVYRNVSKEEQTACNIYNCSPAAEEKRKNMARRHEMMEFQSSNLLTQLLDFNKQSEPLSGIPLLLNKSLSEGCDPFESVKKSLSNGTLQRDKIFSKIKKCENIRIGGQTGSIFNTFVKTEKTSHRTASSSYDSNLNEEHDSNSRPVPVQMHIDSKVENSQNLNRSST